MMSAVAAADETDMAISQTDAAHLLRRSGFGVTPAALADLMTASTRNAAIERVLDTSADPVVANLPVGIGKQTDPFGTWTSMSRWWLERMRTSPTPIVEKMNLFWHNHFVASMSGSIDMGNLVLLHRTIRLAAMGDFHLLAQAVAVDPAMLIYLDNWLNIKGKPQENFGRELMELFTLGTTEYTQQDVQALAKAWTGYTLDADGGYRLAKFNPDWHDSTPQTLFGITKAWTGPEALTEILRGSKAVASSRFLAAKLFSFFAYPVAADDPIVVPLATAFRNSNLNIKALLRAIFRSDAFWSSTSRGALVRSPIEWMVASMQALNLDTDASQALKYVGPSGQMPWLHPDVSGWKQNDYWISTGRAWAGSSFAYNARALALADPRWTGMEAMTSAEAVSTAFARFGITDPSPVTRAALETMCDRSKERRIGATIGVNLVMAILLSPDFQLA